MEEVLLPDMSGKVCQRCPELWKTGWRRAHRNRESLHGDDPLVCKNVQTEKQVSTFPAHLRVRVRTRYHSILHTTLYARHGQTSLYLPYWDVTRAQPTYSIAQIQQPPEFNYNYHDRPRTDIWLPCGIFYHPFCCHQSFTGCNNG